MRISDWSSDVCSSDLVEHAREHERLVRNDADRSPLNAPEAADDVAKRAKTLSDKPFVRPETKLPKVLTDLNYDQYKQIKYKPEKAQGRGNKLPFEIKFYHPGLYFNQNVQQHLEIRRVSVRDRECQDV